MSNVKDIVLLDLFSGIGGFSLGLSQAGFNIKEHYFSEIDKSAIGVYQHQFKNSQYVGSVTDISELPKRPNIITFGSPCFVAGTKVLTDKGYKNIEDVNSNDKALTHKGRFKPVLNLNINNSNKTIHEIKVGKDTETIKCSPNHPFYTVNRVNGFFTSPEWKEAKDLSENDYIVCSKVEKFNESELSPEEAYLMGYYLAEGYLDKTIRKRDGKKMFRIFFCMDKKNEGHFKNLLSKIPYKGRINNKKNISYHADHNYEGRAIKCVVSNQYLYELCEKMGRGAKNKLVPSEILFAPLNIQKAFLDGYMFGDGCFIESINQYQCQSLNTDMAYGIRQLVLNLYNELPTLYFEKKPDKCVINGRTVNQSSPYIIRWKTKKQREVFSYANGNHTVVKVIKNTSYESNEPVFNIGVEGDESYVTGNYVTHNCQDFSLAGKRRGMEGERSSLISQAIALVDRYKPDVFIWENVKGAYSSNNGADFWAIIAAFANLDGYRLEQQLLNTAWVLPQNRERIYLVGHLTTSERSYGEVFPFAENDSKPNEGIDRRVEVSTQRANCLNARMHKMGRDDTYIAETLHGNGVVNTIRSGGRGSLTKKHNWDIVKVKSATKQGFEEANEGDSINLSHPESKTRRGRIGKGVSQTLDTSCNQGVLLPRIGAIRGRSIENPKSRQSGLPTKQMLEISEHDKTNTLTSVQKDNVVLEPYGLDYRTDEGVRIKKNGNTGTLSARARNDESCGQLVNDTYRIRRLTEIECARLQGFPDDWNKYGVFDGEVKEISSTQRYKQYGNAVTAKIVKKIGKRLLNNKKQ